MKFSLLLVAPTVAAAWFSGSKATQLAEGEVDIKDVTGCVSHAEQFIKKPQRKDRAIQKAMDHCAVDKKIEDKNFVCPHFKEILVGAFDRESTTKLFTAKSFCDVAENYISDLKGAANVPNMGKGHGFEFELSKSCKPKVLASFANGQKTLPAKICEAVRSFAHGDIHVMEKNLNQDLDADQVCSIYDDFVENTHINVDAYMHVVHGTKTHPVPAPANRKRALNSAAMKNEAEKNKIRDSSGDPVKSSAAGGSIIFGFVSLVALWAH